MAPSRSGGAASLSRKAEAPARIAAKAYSSRSKVVSTITRGASGVASSRRVVSTPSRRGIRTSISTTSAAVTASRSSASPPSPASPTTTMSSWLSTSIRKPARTICWSSTRNTRIALAHSGSLAETANPPPVTGPASSVAAVHGRPLAHPDQAEPAPVGDRAPRRVRRRAPRPRRRGRRRRARRTVAPGPACLRTLVSASCTMRYAASADAVGHVGPGGRQVGLDPGAGRPRLVDEVAYVVEPGLRRHPGVAVAEQAEQPAHLGERLAAGGRDRLERADRDVGVLGGGVAGAVGLDHDHRQPVGDHVVHLARDARALVAGGELDLALGHPLGLLGARDQRGDVLLPLLRGEAQRPGGGDDRADGDGVGGEVAGGEVARRRSRAASGPRRPPRRRTPTSSAATPCQRGDQRATE